MNGILVIKKPKGYTSRDIVNIAVKSLGTKKIGHTGTLDPMAEGVLVLCVGQALKMCEMLTDHKKTYLAGITLGIETDSLDMEGKVLSTKIVDISDELIHSVVKSFQKTYLQEVPKYSAVKVNGKKLYEYARNNQPVTLPKKEVTIESIEIIDDIITENGHIHFTIKCSVSKGTYIRSLARDIGKTLGVPAVLHSLIRINLGQFSLDDAITLEDLRTGNYQLLNIKNAFPNIPTKTVDGHELFKIKNGAPIDHFVGSDMFFIEDPEKKLIALYKNDDNLARVYKMFT